MIIIFSSYENCTYKYQYECRYCQLNKRDSIRECWNRFLPLTWAIKMPFVISMSLNYTGKSIKHNEK